MLGRLLNEVLKKKPPAYPWGDTLPIFGLADLRIGNLECVISDRGRPWSVFPKVFFFRSDAKNIKALQTARIDMVSVANNHALDYEYEALFEMLQILKEANIAFAGAGANFSQASQMAVRKVAHKKIGLLAFTDNEPLWAATRNHPGVFYIPVNLRDVSAKNFLKLVSKSKNFVDFLIVSAHWGPNWGYTPPHEQISFAHATIDAGADIIFGHSGHVFRGIEFYKDRPIIYCAGDFIDDYAVDEIERNDESFIFVAEVRKQNVIKLILYPTIIHRFQAILAKTTQARIIAEKMEKLSAEFGTKSCWQEGELCLEILGPKGEQR